jgi:DNA replication protein DnaC
MAQALDEQMAQPEITSLAFEDRLGILVDRESDLRENRQLARRLKEAKLKQQACVEDVDFGHPRGLDRSTFFSLANGQWLKKRHNVIITGPAGVGKTFVSCALGNNACRRCAIGVPPGFSGPLLSHGPTEATTLSFVNSRKPISCSWMTGVSLLSR